MRCETIQRFDTEGEYIPKVECVSLVSMSCMVAK